MSEREWKPGGLFLAGFALIGVWALFLTTMQQVFVPGRWNVAGLTICAVTILAGCIIRASWPETRSLAGLGGGLAGLVCWLIWYLESGRVSEWWTDPAEQWREALGVIFDGYAPVTPAGPLEDIALFAILLAATATGLLLVGSGMPLGAGVIPAAFILIPYVVLGLRVSLPHLLLAGLLLALLAWIGSPAPHWTGLIAAGTAVVLAGAVVTAAPDTRDRIWNESVVHAPVSASVPDVTINLANDLRHRSNARAFTFTADVRGPLLFTLATLSDFQEGRWLPDDELNGFDRSVETFWGDELTDSLPEDLVSEVLRTLPRVNVTIEGLVSEWLPLPQPAYAVESDHPEFDPTRWQWAANSMTARSDSTTTQRGDTYSVAISQLPQDLWTYGQSGLVPPEFLQLYPDVEEAPATIRPYLELPEQMPAIIHETASEITGGLTDPLLVGHYLARHFQISDYVYDEEAPYAPGTDRSNPYSVMEALLTEKRGFCVHYASTFAVMARSLGVPSRVSVGYAVAAESNDPTVVRGRQLHAWPEIYVDGFGWVPYEPTPGGAGLRAMDPDFEDPNEPSAAPQPPTDLPAPEEPTPEEPTLGPVTPADPSPSAPEEGPHWSDSTAARVIGIALIGVVLLLLPALLRITRRRRRLHSARRGDQPAQAAWAEFEDTVRDLRSAAGAVPRAHTPEALIEVLRDEGALDADSEEAALSLAELMAAERYSGEAPEHSEAPLEALARARTALVTHASRTARVRATLFPASLCRSACP